MELNRCAFQLIAHLDDIADLDQASALPANCQMRDPPTSAAVFGTMTVSSPSLAT